jgi:peptide/nickel transport system substrate-binding protein
MCGRMHVWRGLIGAGLLLIASATAWAAPWDSAAQPLVVAFKGGATTLDPIMRSETTTNSWQRQIFDTITILAPDGAVQPRIATAWKNLSPTEWQLTLRAGVRFQDGSPMTPDDVGRSILDAKDNPKSQYREYASGVSGYKVVDDHTIRVTFTAVMPEALIAKEGRAAFARHPIGTGPYRFVSWLAQDHLVLEAWSGFWGAQPAFRFVRLENIPEAATRLAALLSGQVQIAEKIDPSDFARVRSSGKAHLSTVPGVRTMYLAVDVWRPTNSAGMAPGTKNPFMDSRVRKAVAEAINVPLIRDKIFNGAAAVATQYTPPGIESHDPSLQPTPYDPADARKLLAAAGYPHGFTMRLDSPNDRYLEDSVVAQAIGGLLGEVGITVKVNAIPKAIFFPQINKGDFTMYFAGWSGTDPVSTWDAIFHCRDPKAGYGHVNRAHYCNPAADALMAKASQTFDDASRIALERQAYAQADKDRAYMPLYYQDEVAGVANDVVWQERPDGLVFVWQMQRK